MTARRVALAVPAWALAFVVWALWIGTALAQPAFPALTGRVVDNAELLSPAAEAQLTARLEALERDTTDQLVVVTIPDLGGYEIADYGYQLGRHWGIGQKEANNGALLIVARDDRKVRIEVGYGLEPILTDGFSTLVIQNEILPAFRDGDFERGISQGVSALDEQMRLDPEEAKARAAKAAPKPVKVDPMAMVTIGLILFVFLLSIIRAASVGGRRYRRDGLTPIIIWGASEILSKGRGGGGSSWGGGGGFGGGGGGFGGGGASGGW